MPTFPWSWATDVAPEIVSWWTQDIVGGIVIFTLAVTFGAFALKKLFHL